MISAGWGIHRLEDLADVEVRCWSQKENARKSMVSANRNVL